MRALFVLLLLIGTAAADDVAVGLEGGQFCCRSPADWESNGPACMCPRCPPMTITDIPRPPAPGTLTFREQVEAIRALGTATVRNTATVTIIRNMKREMDDTCGPCIEKHRWEQGWRDTPPW